MTKLGNYLRFDWAMKKLLRDKANFGILEGFLGTLLDDDGLVIQELLESESNRKSKNDKQNRVDILAKDGKGELIIIEVQNRMEFDYYQRMLFGTSALVTQYMHSGGGYIDIKKIYSVNVLYYKVEDATDFVYRGRTAFLGIHNGEELTLTKDQRDFFKKEYVADIYPEYFILCAHDFDKVAVTKLDEWMEFLSHGVVRDDATARGLDLVREKLRIDQLTPEQQRRYMDSIYRMNDHNKVEAWREKRMQQMCAEAEAKGMELGKAEGLAEGEAKGEKKKALDIARNLKAAGMTAEQIAAITGLSAQEIDSL